MAATFNPLLLPQIQIFHKSRTTKKLGGLGSDSSDEAESESDVEEVLAMRSNEMSSDEDSDEDSEDGACPVSRTSPPCDRRRPRLTAAWLLAEEAVGTKGWGKKRSTFYDGADYEEDSDEGSDDALDAEEAEAKQMQTNRAKLLQSSDFMGEEDEDEEALKPKRKANKKKKKKGKAGADEEEEMETLSKDMSLLNDQQKLQLLTNDAPELLELLNSFTTSLTEIRSQLAPLIQQVKEGSLPTSKGSSFLEVKFHLLLSYCINVVFYMFLKAKGESVKDHPVIETLVKLRVSGACRAAPPTCLVRPHIKKSCRSMLDGPRAI